MSTPIPLNPHGSPLEQSARRKTLPYVVALFAAFHVLALGGLLFLGCSPEKPTVTPPPLGANDHGTPGPIDSSTAPVAPVEPVVNQNSTAQPLNPTPPPPTASGSAQPVTPEPTSAVEYKVRAGDNGYSIAKARGVSVKALFDANPNVDWRHLKVNQSIQIPAATGDAPATSGGTGTAAHTNPSATGEVASIHDVKQGDTLMRLAKKYGVTVKGIRAINGLKSDSIRIGQKLKIPAHTAASTGASRVAPAGTIPRESTSEPVAIPLTPQPK